MIEFLSSDDLKAYVAANNVITWHGIYGMGSLTFIDTSDLHIVFTSRSDYENWRDGKYAAVQFSLF